MQATLAHEPRLSGFRIVECPRVLECGRSLQAGEYTFAWSVSGVETWRATNRVVKITDVTDKRVLVEGHPIDQGAVIELPAIGSDVPARHVWRIEAGGWSDLAAEFSIEFQPRLYFGGTDLEELDLDAVKALPFELRDSIAGRYELPSGQFGVWALPNVLGQPMFNYPGGTVVTMVAPRKLTIPAASGYPVPYTVWRTTYKASKPDQTDIVIVSRAH